MLVAIALTVALTAPMQVASPERQKQLLAEIHARQALRLESQAETPLIGSIIGVETMPPGFVGPPRPIVAIPAPAIPRYSTRPRASVSRAAHRAYNRRHEAEQAAMVDEAQRQYRANLPYVMEAQRRNSELQMRQYEAELRFRARMDFNDAFRGVTRPIR